MKYKLDAKFDYKKTLALFAALALLFGAMCSMLSFFAIPFAAAYIAALIVFSFPKKHGAVITLSVSAAVCLCAAAFGSVSVYSALVAVVIGISIGLTYVSGRTKTEAVAITAGAVVLLTVILLWILAWLGTGSASFSSLRDFYTDVYSLLKSEIASTLNEQYESLGSQFSAADIEAAAAQTLLYMDSALKLIPSIFVIGALILSGFAFKMFGLTVYKHSAEKSAILAWRFKTSNVFVIFYIIVAIAYLFVSDGDVLSVSIVNLYSILHFVYAYIGYNFVTALLAGKMRLGLARLIVIAAIFIFSSFSVQILAVGGVIFTFICNKAGGFPQNKGPLNGSHNRRDESEDDDEKH